MLFNSLIFVAFAIVYFLVQKLIGKHIRLRLAWLTVMSFFFYGWWDWRFLFLILFSGLVDYFSALAMDKWEKHSKTFLVLSIIGNLGSLCIFKYSGFIAHNLDALLGLSGSFSLYNHIPEFFLVTPIGISFYTFHSMNYTIDVYHRKFKPTRDIFHFFAFISMFPQLVAGPILRAKEILPQLLVIKKITDQEKWEGFSFVVKGYFKKMVIADNLAPLVVSAFSAPEINHSSMYWWGTSVAFALQIYCDFAGYTDIARGLAKWMGYDFPKNFDHPYISTSMREFWTRWHISLSSWFRDYVYIPLGGNRKGKVMHHVNMWITMLVSGLWHGAMWTFIAWGGIHALFLSVERMLGLDKIFNKNQWLKIIGWMVVSVQVLIAWMFFRAVSIEQAWQIVKTMFSFKGDLNLGWGLNGTVIIGLILIHELIVAVRIKEKIDWSQKQWAYSEMMAYAAIIAAIIYFRGNGSEFIYFQF